MLCKIRIVQIQPRKHVLHNVDCMDPTRENELDYTRSGEYLPRLADLHHAVGKDHTDHSDHADHTDHTDHPDHLSDEWMFVHLRFSIPSLSPLGASDVCVVSKKPDVLRLGIVGMAGSSVIRLRPCMT